MAAIHNREELPGLFECVRDHTDELFTDLRALGRYGAWNRDTFWQLTR